MTTRSAIRTVEKRCETRNVTWALVPQGPGAFVFAVGVGERIRAKS